MLAEFKNIGMIREARLDLSGLCVIAGENDTSKSVLGKTLFSVIKAFQTQDSVQGDKITRLRKYLASLFSGDFASRFTKESGLIRIGGDAALSDRGITESVDGLLSLEITDRLPFRDAVMVANPGLLRLAGLIPLAESFLGEAALREDGRVFLDYLAPLHVRDLLDKLQSETQKEQDDITEYIRTVIRGKVSYNSELKDFQYNKVDPKSNHESSYASLNTANGIKSFGIIQVLYQNGFLNDETLLILDEPEVHLHPKWQIRYAELLVRIVSREKVSVLLASHSPYFIEALKLYGEQYEIDDKSTFYMAHLNEDGLTSSIVDVSSELDRVFDILSEPFRELELLSMNLI